MSEGLWIEEPQDTSQLSNAEKKRLDETRITDANNAMTAPMFPRIMAATNAKATWQILEQEFEGESKLIAMKIQSLRKDFESLKMNEPETIQDYSSRVTEVVNQLYSLGEKLSNKTVGERVLNSLPEKYDDMVAVIEEMKDLSTLTLQQLLGSLKNREQRILRCNTHSIESAFQSKSSVGSHNNSDSSKGTDSKKERSGWSKKRRLAKQKYATKIRERYAFKEFEFILQKMQKKEP